MVHELSRSDARRIAVRAQLLAEPRPVDLMATVRHLCVLQTDPTAAVAPSAELVAWSRLGPSYRLGDVEALVTTGSLVELHRMLRPAEDIALFRAEMAAWPGAGELRDWQVDTRNWLLANDDARRDLLEKLYDEGPLRSAALPDTTTVPWESSGWNNDRSKRMLLQLMVSRGEVAAAGYEGRDKLWDLAERVYPDQPAIPSRRPTGSGASGGCTRSGSPGPGRRGPRTRPTTWATPASRRPSRGSAGGGGWTRRTSTTTLPAARRCSPRSTGC